jgi:hypothetical protein
MKRGVVHLPLHYGKMPSWLFSKMKILAKEIITIIIDEFEVEGFLKKIADPFWFQAFGSILGFDWHSSGLTTTVCGAMKEGIKGVEKELGIFIVGGKGRTALKVKEEIERKSKYLPEGGEKLSYISRLVAKVDSAGLQDGYQLYHHVMFFDKNMKWAIVQQGMNPEIKLARRYHWLGEKIYSFVNSPHSGIISERKEKLVLNTVAKGYEDNRAISIELATSSPEKTVTLLKKLQSINLPKRHYILLSDINPKYFYKILCQTYEKNIKTYEALLATKGVGAKTIRALTLISELIYGAKTNYEDPARFTFAHGGKDGYPYPVDKTTYEKTIAILEKAIKKSKLGDKTELKALRKLEKLINRKT